MRVKKIELRGKGAKRRLLIYGMGPRGQSPLVGGILLDGRKPSEVINSPEFHQYQGDHLNVTERI